MLAHRPTEPSFIPDPADEQTSNSVEIVGYIGRDPQVRYTAEGTMVASISLATHHWHDEDGAAVQTTDWHRAVAYGDAASAAAAFRPGDLVRISGRLHTRSWRDRFGSHHERTEVVATEVGRARRRPAQIRLDAQPTARFASATS
jgi:single-strand DNA-binding protein